MTAATEVRDCGYTSIRRARSEPGLPVTPQVARDLMIFCRRLSPGEGRLPSQALAGPSLPLSEQAEPNFNLSASLSELCHGLRVAGAASRAGASPGSLAVTSQ